MTWKATPDRTFETTDLILSALPSLLSSKQDERGFLRTTNAVKNVLACWFRSTEWIKEVCKSVRVA